MPDASTNPSDDGPWALPEQEPTNLMALWPDEHAPTRIEVLAALQSCWDGLKVLEDIDPEDPEVPWAIAIKAPQLAEPAIIWCEPARPVPPGELDDTVAEACRWAIGIETMLDPDDALGSYHELVRLLVAPLPDVPGVMDVNSTSWLRREALDTKFLPDTAMPPADVLWIIHAVSSNRGSLASGSVWLHTHGLWRCGRPELEMIAVEKNYISSAARLLNEIAERLLDVSPPSPGTPLQLGEGLLVTLHPWQEVMGFIDDDAPGGANDRAEDQGENPHTGIRAVVCGERSPDASPETWIWPREALACLERDEAVLYKTARATRRLAQQAQHTWGELATAFVKLKPHLSKSQPNPRAVVLVKVAFPYEEDAAECNDSPAEHLWFEALGFEGDTARGRLLNEPLHVPRLHREDVYRLERERMTDWVVQTVHGQYGPSNVAELWRTVDRLDQAPEITP